MRAVALVFPAYNAQKTLKATIDEIPKDFGDFLILVDDGSSDETAEISESLGIQTLRHPVNMGYGANQKSCYRAALATEAEIVVMIHPDHQYDARVAPIMVSLIELGICDVVLGNRIRTRAEALRGGMPLWKYLTNRMSTLLENFFLGQSLGDFHSGFRAYSREVLESIPFDENSDDFAFDQEFLIQSIFAGFRIGDVPVPVRYMKEASSISFRRSLRYGLGGLNAFVFMKLHQFGLRRDRRFTGIARRTSSTG